MLQTTEISTPWNLRSTKEAAERRSPNTAMKSRPCSTQPEASQGSNNTQHSQKEIRKIKRNGQWGPFHHAQRLLCCTPGTEELLQVNYTSKQTLDLKIPEVGVGGDNTKVAKREAWRAAVGGVAKSRTGLSG